MSTHTSSASDSSTSSMTGLVLVYGATGHQAGPLATQLLESGRKVRVVTRVAEHAAHLAELGAEVAVADLSDADALASASKGVESVYLIVPFFDSRPEYAANAIAAASAAGVRLIVWNPTGDIPQVETGNPGLDVRRSIRDLLDQSGVPYIAVVPTAYLENFLQPAIVEEIGRDNVFAYPIPIGASMQWISHRDAAAFAVAALNRPMLANAIIPVAGPEAVDGQKIAAAFSRALGRSITFRAMPPAEFGGVLGAVFGPEAGAGIAAAYEQIFANPKMASSSVDFAAAVAQLPIEPTTIEAWVRERAHLFTSRS